MNYIIVDTGADRGQWLTIRRTGITATDIARLSTGGASVRPAIRAEKLGHERFFETRATAHGKAREPIIAQYAYEEFGMTHNTALLAALDEPRFLATPDLLGTVGDIKTTVHDWESWADVPRPYVPQLLWQMRVTGDREAKLIFEPHEAFVPIYPLPRHLVLEYDEAAVARLEEIALEFLDSNEEPDPDAAEMDAMLAAYAAEKELADQANRALEARRSLIEEHLGGQPRKFNGSVGNLTRSADGTSARFDTTGFKKAFPDISKAWTKDVPTKGRLTITIADTNE